MSDAMFKGLAWQGQAITSVDSAANSHPCQMTRRWTWLLVSRFFEHAHQMQTWQTHAAKSEARKPFRWKCSEVSHISLVKARAVSPVLSTSSFEPWGGWSLLRALSVSSHHHSSLLRGYRSMKLPIANLSKLHFRRLSVRGVVPCRMPCSRAWRGKVKPLPA